MPTTSTTTSPPTAPTATSSQIINADHPRWNEFLDALGAALDRTKCKGGMSKVLSRRIMRDMGLDRAAIAESCRWFETWGGYCDCEVLSNVSWWAEVVSGEEEEE